MPFPVLRIHRVGRKKTQTVRIMRRRRTVFLIVARFDSFRVYFFEYRASFYGVFGIWMMR